MTVLTLSADTVESMRQAFTLYCRKKDIVHLLNLARQDREVALGEQAKWQRAARNGSYSACPYEWHPNCGLGDPPPRKQYYPSPAMEAKCQLEVGEIEHRIKALEDELSQIKATHGANDALAFVAELVEMTRR